MFRRFRDIVHPIHWSARKLRHVAHRSATAEILSVAEATSMGLYVRGVIGESILAPCVASTNHYCSLKALATPVHEPEEQINKIKLITIHEDYDKVALMAVHWFPRPTLLADDITRDNRMKTPFLQATLTSGMYERPKELRRRLGHHPIQLADYGANFSKDWWGVGGFSMKSPSSGDSK